MCICIWAIEKWRSPSKRTTVLWHALFAFVDKSKIFHEKVVGKNRFVNEGSFNGMCVRICQKRMKNGYIYIHIIQMLCVIFFLLYEILPKQRCSPNTIIDAGTSVYTRSIHVCSTKAYKTVEEAEEARRG